MDTFNQEETGCYLLNINAYRLRSVAALQMKILDGCGIPVEGLFTQHDPARKKKKRYNPFKKSNTNSLPVKPKSVDIFDFSKVTLAINGQFIQGEFVKMKETRTHFYMNTSDIPSSIALLMIEFSEKENISVLDSLENEGLRYTFCTNTVLPDLDMMAAKLVAI